MKWPICITHSAQDRIREILQQHPENYLMVGVNNKGCSGHSYTFDLVQPSQIKKFDEVIKIDDISVVVEASSLLKLIGSTLDWHSDRFGSKFVWHNPMVKNTCGCGESVGF